MSPLDKEEKMAISKYRIQRAKETYEDAVYNLKGNKYSTAVNRSYYAVLSAARALLILKGVDTSTHSGCKTMLSLHYVKQGMLSQDMLETFKVLLSRRTDVDYGDFEDIDKGKADDSVNKAKHFIDASETLLTSLIQEMK